MSIQWTRRVKGISGSRWNCYETFARGKIDISWPEFKDAVVRYNPVLKQDGWLFKAKKEYLLPAAEESAVVLPGGRRVLTGVPYYSQVDNPHTDGRYWGSDPDRKDETPDGCWMNELPNGGHFGQGAKDCPGPMDRGCIRPGSCNVTSLFMMCEFFGMLGKPSLYPDGSRISNWLQQNPMSPAWLYVYMMDYWSRGRQIWDGVDPTTALNSRICARGDYLQETAEQVVKASGLNISFEYTTSTVFTRYKQAIDDNSPVVINSNKLHHVILGIGYDSHDNQHWIIAHDPYGRKRVDLGKWVEYNGCGERDEKGKEVEYPFHLLGISYLLYGRRG